MPSAAISKKVTQVGVIGVLALAAYLITMPRLITLEDAGLFQMVCHVGGIGHPPGYPLFTLLCQQLILQDSVFSGNLISVMFAVAAVMVFFSCRVANRRSHTCLNSSACLRVLQYFLVSGNHH